MSRTKATGDGVETRPPDAPGATSSALEAGAARVRRAQNDVAEAEERVPLQRKILEALAEQPATPTVLAQRIGAAQASTSRMLATLRKQGLVNRATVPGDQRLRTYELTREGQTQLSRHRAFGPAPAAPPATTSDERSLFLRGALDSAVAARRQANHLDVATERLRVVLERAEELGDQGLAVDAIAELATTLRQAGRPDQVAGLLDRLKGVALGEDPGSAAAVVLPAFAHREYALGRMVEDELTVSASHLKAAITAYGAIAQAPRYGQAADWQRRAGWSVAGLAANLRQQSDFEGAFVQSGKALGMFSAVDDPYGRSRCFFLLGFCLRLLGHFDSAWSCLEAAHQLADEHHFERHQADALLQLGEVCRCRGDLDQAREMLRESVTRAEHLQLTLTQAFAHSALGAVEYQEDRLGRAEQALERADALFQRKEHREGMALNDRRRAAVARCTLASSTRGDADTVRHFIAAARGRYLALHSPAGLTACEIEDGRLSLLVPASPRTAVDALNRRLDNTHQRDLIEKDPWVPQVLARFAHDAQDERLSERADRLTAAAAERRHSDSALHVVESSVVTAAAEPVSISTGGGSAADEMGGETRRERRLALKVA
jgi:DNA-binding MarR family transcriptional regulator